jgi:acetolactate synthase I/II/III large subunit
MIGEPHPGVRVPAARNVVAALVAAGVDHAFTVPGESFLALLNELYDEPAIRTVATRHEGGAAFMAEAYAKVTRRPTVCMATRGVGAANLAIGIHTAHQDSSPVLALVGQVSTDARHREAFQEVDLQLMLGAISLWSLEPADATQLGELTYRAARVATEGRQGPVCLAYREDLLVEGVTATDFPTQRPSRPHPDAASVIETLRQIRAATTPVLLVGQDVVASHATPQLVALAEREGVPVVAVWRHPDAFPNDHPLYAGHSGLGSLPCVRSVLAEADLWVVIGDRLDENTTSGFSLPSPGTDVVHAYLDAGRLEPRGEGTGILTGADSFATSLLAASLADPIDMPAARAVWTRGVRERWEAQSTPRPQWVRPGYVDQFEVVAAMRRLLPPGTVFVTDAGNFSSWGARYLRWNEPGTFVGPVSGAMGYAVPAAIGAKLARPEAPVVAVAGDGGFLMSATELQTAAREAVPMTVVVFDNGTFGTIRMHQERHYPGRPIATHLGETDLVAFAESLGARGFGVTAIEAFEPALTEALAADGPCVIVVRIDPEQISVAMRDAEL